MVSERAEPMEEDVDDELVGAEFGDDDDEDDEEESDDDIDEMLEDEN